MGLCLSYRIKKRSRKNLNDLKSEESFNKTLQTLNTTCSLIPIKKSKDLSKITLRQPVLKDLKKNKLYMERMEMRKILKKNIDGKKAF